MSNKTLIMPCAGKSSRFPGSTPKWMLSNSSGECMLDMAMRPYQDKVDKIIVAITKKQLTNNFLLDFFKNKIDRKFSLCVLEEQTKSASDTVYQTIKSCRVEGDIIIKDCDCYVDYVQPDSNNYIVGLDIKNSNSFSRLESKSFIKKDSNDIIVDIIEKKIVSNSICVGTYACGSSSFSRNYLELCENPVFYDEVEIYVSYVFSKMILANEFIFSYVEADQYVDWGTVDEWNQNKDNKYGE
jgi:hypothetical protein